MFATDDIHITLMHNPYSTLKIYEYHHTKFHTSSLFTIQSKAQEHFHSCQSLKKNPHTCKTVWRFIPHLTFIAYCLHTEASQENIQLKTIYMHWNVLLISNKIHFNINYNKQLAVHCPIANINIGI